MAEMVRVEKELHEKLSDLAAKEHRSIAQVIESAVNQYQVEQFWQQMEADYARLKKDPEALQDYLQEADEWQSLTGDTLADEPPFPEDGVEETDGNVPRSEGR